jgi:hypothetical protein
MRARGRVSTLRRNRIADGSCITADHAEPGTVLEDSTATRRSIWCRLWEGGCEGSLHGYVISIRIRGRVNEWRGVAWFSRC